MENGEFLSARDAVRAMIARQRPPVPSLAAVREYEVASVLRMLGHAEPRQSAYPANPGVESPANARQAGFGGSPFSGDGLVGGTDDSAERISWGSTSPTISITARRFRSPTRWEMRPPRRLACSVLCQTPPGASGQPLRLGTVCLGRRLGNVHPNTGGQCRRFIRHGWRRLRLRFAWSPRRRGADCSANSSLRGLANRRGAE